MSEAKTEAAQTLRKAYISGYALSLVLTALAYALVRQHAYTRDVLLGLIVGLALVQFGVQLVCFLHLGRGRWKSLAFWMMTLVVLILVFGSLWIMQNLNVRMTPQQMNQYMQSQDSL
ncbi:MAG TPA: cytochrome C oxidase subunit IV family protein [Candidatus Saccharimonadales bacterium]